MSQWHCYVSREKKGKCGIKNNHARKKIKIRGKRKKNAHVSACPFFWCAVFLKKKMRTRNMRIFLGFFFFPLVFAFFSWRFPRASSLCLVPTLLPFSLCEKNANTPKQIHTHTDLRTHTLQVARGFLHMHLTATSLQHTATHCNTLQHTATHCNELQSTTAHSVLCVCVCVHAACCSVFTLQHTATHCNTLQHTATHCNTYAHATGWSPAAQMSDCNIPQRTATRCNTLQRTATHCNTHQAIRGGSPGAQVYDRMERTRKKERHCNKLYTLQHTATHCNTLQHTATHRK